MRLRSLVASLILAVSTCTSIAQADAGSEKEARALFEEGNALVEKGSYVEALEKFRAAYARWANPKILLNVGTTLRQLGRYPEAADTYDAWLKDPAADPKRKDEVTGVLADLDAKVGKLAVDVKEGKARILVDGRDVGEAAPTRTLRVEPGSHSVVADREGADAISRTVAVGAGETRAVVLVATVATGGATGATTSVAPQPSPTSFVGPRDAPTTTEEAPRTDHGGRVGVSARGDFDGKGRGAVVVPALSYGVVAQLEVGVGALLGRNKGTEPSATIYLLRGAFSPRIVLAAPIFFIDGSARAGLRAAGGIEWDPSAHVGFFADLGAAHFFSAPAGYEPTALVASIGAQARL